VPSSLHLRLRTYRSGKDIGDRGPGWQRWSRPHRSCAYLGQACDRSVERIGESDPGRIFRAVSRHGTPWGKGISENVIWYVVRRCAERVHLDHLAPHDLRRTCAKLCHVHGGELEPDSVSSWSCFRVDNRAISGLQAEPGGPCKQSLRLPFRSDILGFTVSSVFNIEIGCPRLGAVGEQRR
jgi:hypothetical protein